MPMGADILLRLAKAGLFGLALLVASVVLAPGASAHGMHHHPAPSTSGGGHEVTTAALPAIAAASALLAERVAFVAAWQGDAPSGAPCPDGSGGHAGHPGCCTGFASCAVSCGGAMVVLPVVPDLGPFRPAPPPIPGPPLSVGRGSDPGDHPPRSLI